MVTYLEAAAKKIGTTQTIAAKWIDSPLWRLNQTELNIKEDDEYTATGDEPLYMNFIVTDMEINMLGSEYWDATRAAMERKRNRLIRSIEKLQKDKQTP